MSEYSLIANKYNRIKNISENFNNAVITIKKRSLSSNDNEKTLFSVSEDEYTEANNDLLKCISIIENLSEEDIIEEYNHYKTLIENSELKARIQKVKKRILEKKDANNSDFEILDKVLNLIEDEKIYLFKKLRLSKG